MKVDAWFGSDGACDMCFPGYSKTCMPTVRQIVDCLVAARPMPIRCGPCLTAKSTNHATNNRSSSSANRIPVGRGAFHGLSGELKSYLGRSGRTNYT
ncbi:hypothetical protein KM043_006371 [Ampulex compressa]|nr:hypothetical protein KM043_006371 [Ampulex compressa]